MIGGDTAFESTVTVLAAKGLMATEPPQQNEASALAPVTLNRRFSRTTPSSCAWRDEVEPPRPHCSMAASLSQDPIALMNSSSSVVRAHLLFLLFLMFRCISKHVSEMRGAYAVAVSVAEIAWSSTSWLEMPVSISTEYRLLWKSSSNGERSPFGLFASMRRQSCRFGWQQSSLFGVNEVMKLPVRLLL